MRRQQDERSLSISLSLSHFLGIFAFCVLGIFLKPQVAWLHPTRENLAKTTQWGSLYLPPFRGNEICLQIWFACHAQHN